MIEMRLNSAWRLQVAWKIGLFGELLPRAGHFTHVYERILVHVPHGSYKVSEDSTFCGCATVSGILCETSAAVHSDHSVTPHFCADTPTVSGQPSRTSGSALGLVEVVPGVCPASCLITAFCPQSWVWG